MSSADTNLFDVTIVGGGPVGLFAAFYAGLRGLKTKIIDASAELGGQLVTLYPEKYVYDVAGLPKILAKDLARDLASQAQQFKPTVCLNAKVATLEKRDDGSWKITTEGSTEHLSRTVVLAIGAGASAPKKLTVPYNAAFEGVSVFYAVTEREKFRDKNVLIIGGGDSAVDWANDLSQVAKHVCLIHRSDKFRAVQTSVDEMTRKGVDVKTFHELKQVNGTEKLEGAVIFDNRTKAEETIQVDAILINIGFSINLGFLKAWGLTLQNNAIVVNEKMETNLDGVYAVGDICTHAAKLKLIATGVGEAAIAVNFAATKINPSAKAFPGHSSNLDLKV